MILRLTRVVVCCSLVHVGASLQLQQQSPLLPGGNASNACQNAVRELIDDEYFLLTLR